MSGTFCRNATLIISVVFGSLTTSYASDDVIRLRGSKSADTIRLNGTGSIKDDGALISRLDLRDSEPDDTHLVGARVGGAYHGGYHGGGGYGGYRGGVYGGYRGGVYGGYRGFYSGYRTGFYGGYYGGYRGYYPRYSYGLGYSYYPRYSIGIGFGGYYPYYSSYDYYSPYIYGSYCPISSGNTIVQVPSPSLQNLPDSQPLDSRPMSPTIQDPNTDQTLPLPKGGPSKDGTYRYDGGPMNPVPMPRQDFDSSKQSTPRAIPDRSVSIKSEPQAKKYSYPAYGEKSTKQPAKKDEKFVSVKTNKP